MSQPNIANEKDIIASRSRLNQEIRKIRYDAFGNESSFLPYAYRQRPFYLRVQDWKVANEALLKIKQGTTGNGLGSDASIKSLKKRLKWEKAELRTLLHPDQVRINH